MSELSTRLHALAEALEAPVFDSAYPTLMSLFLHPKSTEDALAILAALPGPFTQRGIEHGGVLINAVVEKLTISVFAPKDSLVPMPATSPLTGPLAAALKAAS